MITSMGFTEKQSKKALKATDGNVERAIDWIFSHMDDLDDESSPAESATSVGDQTVSQTAFSGSNSSKYDLVAFISHMGSNTSCGHYVCHVVSDDQSEGSLEGATSRKWLLFNDNKVAFSKEPPKDLGYLYLYKQI